MEEIYRPSMTRRCFLNQTACGIGTMALAELLHLDGRAANAATKTQASLGLPHFPAKAKNVIFLFMAGAPSQLDLFDPKPKMKELHGQPVPASFLEALKDPVIKGSARVMASPRSFNKYGDCGMDFSDYLPHLSTCANDLCMIRSMHTDVSNHDPGQLLMNCGVPLYGHPSMGAWVVYGLGSESQNLPGFIVLLSNSGKGIDGGSALWSNGFLPSSFRGVTLRSPRPDLATKATSDAILHLSNPDGVTDETQRARLAALRDLNQVRHKTTGDPEIVARIAAYEMAFRMQSAAPELLDFTKESQKTLEMYGIDREKTRWFGTNCLLARRLVERGVRFVQLYHSTWDDHDNLNENLKTNCDMTDQPAAALIQDLKQRGLLDETLVIWGGEFGRTPMNEVRRGIIPGKEGRDHHPFGFTMLLGGGGVKGGVVIGQTDELGYHAIEDRVHIHDLQATILHCLGIDHTRLTFFHDGRDFRLTDVGGNVIKRLLT